LRLPDLTIHPPCFNAFHIVFCHHNVAQRTSVEEADLTITAKGAVVLVAGMTGILLAMYYLRAFLVYVVIFLFATGGAASLALVGSRIAADMPPGPTVRMYCGGEETDVKVCGSNRRVAESTFLLEGRLAALSNPR
jgi:hypothetical protein